MTSAAHARDELAQVVLVTGKGGVGKTSVAAGLAVAAARREGSAVLVEFGDGHAGKRALGKESGVIHRTVEPAGAVEDMAAGVFGSALLSKVVIGNFAMKRLIRAAPALRELGQLEAIRRESADHPGKRVVVDMPATGHGLAWLRVPSQMSALLTGGPLHEVAARLARDVVAPGKCSIVVVTLPERLVLEETLELCEAMKHAVGLEPARFVVNRVPDGMPAHAMAEARRLAQREDALGAAAGVLVEVVAARDQARGEALAAVAEITGGRTITPAIIPDAPLDPSAAQMADWLSREAVA
jgi:anion-transporting  ArsA/GET3 family ATPase